MKKRKSGNERRLGSAIGMMEKWKDLKGRRHIQIKVEGIESKTTGFSE